MDPTPKPPAPDDPAPTPVPPAPAVSDHFTDLPGWKLAFSENFEIPCKEGEFLAKYGTRFTCYSGEDSSSRGQYTSSIISVANGVLTKRLHTAGGIHKVASILPRLSDVGKRGSVLYGKFAMTMRTDVIPGYKLAWLLWPQGGNVPEFKGEIDFPEFNLYAGVPAKAFMHYRGVPYHTAVGDERQYRVKTAAVPRDWTTFSTEWTPGLVVFKVNEVEVGRTTDRTPRDPMFWSLQTETQINDVPIDPAMSGKVQISRLGYWTKVA